jgi:hypothetical protein
MKHGQISRNSAKAFFAFAALALVGACADNSAVAPTAEAPAFVAPANFIKIGYVVAFRVDNSKGITQKIGEHVINIPANAICELAVSGYGADYWNKSCSPMKGSIVVTATVLQGPDGAPMIDFQPAMRFNPEPRDQLLQQRRALHRRVPERRFTEAVPHQQHHRRSPPQALLRLRDRLRGPGPGHLDRLAPQVRLHGCVG